MKVYEIAASEMAEELGDLRAANMIVLGSFLKISGMVAPETVQHAGNRMIHSEVDADAAGLGHDMSKSAVERRRAGIGIPTDLGCNSIADQGRFKDRVFKGRFGSVQRAKTSI